MLQRVVRIELGNYTRESDAPDELEALCSEVELWAFLSKQVYTYTVDDSNVTVEIDWSPVSAYAIEARNFFPESHHSLPPTCPPRELTATVNGLQDRPNADGFTTDLVRLAIYDTFFVANLSVPGSFNPLGASVTLPKGSNTEPEINVERMEVSSTLIEHTYYESKTSGLDLLDYLNPEETWRWYQNLGLNTRQRSRCKVDRGLFSLLHASAEHSDSPAISVWIAHSLEALFETPPTLSFAFLFERAALLLEMDANGQKHLKKVLREIYDLRNRFAHGGLQIPHPLLHDIWDGAVLDHYEIIFSPIYRGTEVVLATFQKLIKNKWSEFSFSQRVMGSPFTDRVSTEDKVSG